jgi:hypothetical protein
MSGLTRRFSPSIPHGYTDVAMAIAKVLGDSPSPIAFAWRISPLIGHLQWAIGGSRLLHHLGLHVELHDLDIVGTLEDFEQISECLASAFGNPSQTSQPSYKSIGLDTRMSRHVLLRGNRILVTFRDSHDPCLGQ